MESLLSSTNLFCFVKEDFKDVYEKRQARIAWFLILSTIDESVFSFILSKFGRVHSAKACWNALEMEYNRTMHHI